MELLYIEGDEKQHYVYIKDFNRLVLNFTKHTGSKDFCMHCMKNFYSKEDLAKHQIDCIIINGVQAIQLREPYMTGMDKKEFQASIFKIIINNCPFLL